jgi:hypothetical protein
MIPNGLPPIDPDTQYALAFRLRRHIAIEKTILEGEGYDLKRLPAGYGARLEGYERALEIIEKPSLT